MTEAELDRMMRKTLLDAIALDEKAADDPENAFQPSRRHSRQMQQMRRDPLHWARNRNRGTLQKTARWAAVILLFITLSFSLVMLFSAPARAAFERWVSEWYRTHIVYRYNGEREGALPRYELTGLPEGFSELERIEEPTYAFAYVIYGNESGELISFSYTVMAQGGATEFVPNDDDVYQVTVGKDQGALFIPKDAESMKTLTWIDEKNGIHFTLVADLSEPDMIALAESLRKKKK